MNVKIFIGGFPLDMDEMGLAELISPHGGIVTLKIVRNKQTRICKGYAFVELASKIDALSVIVALDGQTMGDRQLTVKLTDETPAPPPIKSDEPLKRRKRPRIQ